MEAVEDVALKDILCKYPDRRVKAGPGENSRPHVLLGKPGNDVVIQVPRGVTVVDTGNNQLGECQLPPFVYPLDSSHPSEK